MNYIAFTHFPGGRMRCLTFSYDDGRPQDRQLVALFNKHNMKGTFHLNSPALGKENYITRDEVPELFTGHEVACHAVHHPFMDNQPDAQILNEVIEDRKALEEIVGYPVRGMSYPYGVFNDRIVNALKSTGIRYNRTTKAHHAFHLPENFMTWHSTTHHKNVKPETVESFLNPAAGQKRWGMLLFYIWGHSYEFDTEEKWQEMDALCGRLAGNDDVWYATNIEIYDYVTALHRLEFSAKCDMVFNPSSQAVWFTVNQDVVEVGPGETKGL